MSSNGRAQLFVAVIAGAVVMGVSQLGWHRKLRLLEHQVTQLREELVSTQRSAPQSGRAELAQWMQGDLASLPKTHTVQVMTDEELDQLVAGVGVPPPGPVAVVAPDPTSPQTAVGEPSTRLIRRVEKGGVLLRKGRTQIEPTVSYSHLSRNRVGLSGFSVFDVIFIGEIRAEEIDRDLVTSSVNIRHGITNNLQAEVEVPMQFQREEILSGPIEDRQEEVNRRHGLTDINGGIFYQFANEHSWIPNLIAHARVKAPTGNAPQFGSGVWGFKGGLIMVKSSDPIVLFSNAAYTVNFPGQVNGLDTNPGDSFEYSAGIAYALNYNVAVNAAFEQIFVGPSASDGVSLTGSRLVVGNLKAGLTYALSKNLSMDLSLGTGLTEDSPDFTVTVSFPYTF